jgi:hypothetical protein
MTKAYRPIVPSRIAEELNIALASAEPKIICKAIGNALS